MTARRSAAAWLAAGALATVVSSPWWPAARRVLRRPATPRTHEAVAQAVAPLAGLAALPLAALTVAARPRAAAAALAVVGGAGVAQTAWVGGRRRPPVRPAGPTLSIAALNLFYDNRDPRAMATAIERLDVDVLVMSEFTHEHHRLVAAHGARFAHRIERPAARAAGMALWSKHPVEERPAVRLGHHRLTVDACVGGRPVRIVAVHTRSPMAHPLAWHRDLSQLASEAPPADRPAVLIGDFNAAWTHPHLRAISGQGWDDAHRALGRGWQRTWRTDWPVLPPFVKLDHALVGPGTAVVDAGTIRIPGSDHHGVVVTIALPPDNMGR